jgi:hypothetical protein
VLESAGRRAALDWAAAAIAQRKGEPTVNVRKVRVSQTAPAKKRAWPNSSQALKPITNQTNMKNYNNKTRLPPICSN